MIPPSIDGEAALDLGGGGTYGPGPPSDGHLGTKAEWPTGQLCGITPVCWTTNMNLTVKGKNIDVGEALRTHVAQSLDHAIAKYFGNPIEATVIFSKQSHLFSADIAVHIGRGILVHAEESADQAYAAFDHCGGSPHQAHAPLQAPAPRSSPRGDAELPRVAVHPRAGGGGGGRARGATAARRRR